MFRLQEVIRVKPCMVQDISDHGGGMSATYGVHSLDVVRTYTKILMPNLIPNE